MLNRCLHIVFQCIFTIGTHLQCEFHAVHSQVVYILTQRKHSTTIIVCTLWICVYSPLVPISNVNFMQYTVKFHACSTQRKHNTTEIMAVHCNFVYTHLWYPSPMWISCRTLSISIYLHKEIITPQKLWLYIVTLCILTFGTHLQCEFHAEHCQLVYIYTKKS